MVVVNRLVFCGIYVIWFCSEVIVIDWIGCLLNRILFDWIL